MREEAEELADEHDMLYCETSAKENINVPAAFEQIIEQVYQNKFASDV